MIMTLGSVCTFLNGGTPSRSVARYFEGDVPWITGADIVGPTVDRARGFITEEAIRDSATNHVPTETVLLVTRTSVGKVAIAGMPLCFSQDITAITPDPKRLNTGYLVHFLRTKQSYLERAARGATIKGVTREVVANIPVALPPLPEQRRIAEVLDRADALRAKRRAALAQVDTLTQAIFLDMFGDPVTNKKAYPVYQMGDVCDVRDGTHDSPKYGSEGGYPLVTSKNVSGGFIDLTDVNYISEADYIQINKRSKVDRGDIIMPMIGTIGSPVLVDHEPRYAIKNLALVKFTERSPSAIFVHHLLNCHYFDHIVSQKNRGGTQKFVSLGDLRAFPLPLPPQKEQQEFAYCVEAVDKVRTINQASLAELDALFASLQYRAFRGEL